MPFPGWKAKSAIFQLYSLGSYLRFRDLVGPAWSGQLWKPRCMFYKHHPSLFHISFYQVHFSQTIGSNEADKNKQVIEQ